MNIKSVFASIITLMFSTIALADLVPFKDYDISEAVWSISTIRVDANMEDAYLEGLKQTWVASNEVSKKLGHIESYSMFRSDLPQSGDFNLLLIVKFANTSDLAPNKKRYEDFLKEWGDSKSQESTDYAQKNYPGMRTITGSYNMREITLK
ncbi:MAG: hypothetical protein AB8B48_14955 [Pseudomonadales bacterium]